MMCFKLWKVNCNKCENKSLLQKIAWTKKFSSKVFLTFSCWLSTPLISSHVYLAYQPPYCFAYTSKRMHEIAFHHLKNNFMWRSMQTSGRSSWIVSRVHHATSHLLHDLFRTLFACFAHELCRKTVCRWWKWGALTMYVCSYTCEKYSACIEYNIWQFFTPQEVMKTKLNGN